MRRFAYGGALRLAPDYDTGRLDLLPYLSPRGGRSSRLIGALRRISGYQRGAVD